MYNYNIVLLNYRLYNSKNSSASSFSFGFILNTKRYWKLTFVSLTTFTSFVLKITFDWCETIQPFFIVKVAVVFSTKKISAVVK